MLSASSPACLDKTMIKGDFTGLYQSDECLSLNYDNVFIFSILIYQLERKCIFIENVREYQFFFI